ncbi:DUF2206 domain-containing protein [Methanococcus aeolicus]|uniref:DUF2206 domain-containing protein n=1 Tax=Methanococcus aeolicus TaxID=42879 RepID=UPI0021C79FC0|nr:DUF2206 domain-containing protein [Methanococcus aeolicus]UXM85420.1 DUF2206 domain-containing protein [Methanococcus aeolicus]
MIQNPFKLQNWKFKKFLMVILFFQLSLLGLFALNKLGVNTPIIRPLIGFIYLSFIPGYLLLRILRLHKLSTIESFLYALGLSLFMDMFVGFLMNIFYPILGITDKPISEIPIVLTMVGAVFLLCIVAYLRDKDHNNPDYIDLKDILTPQVLFLSLIPFMAIFGTYLVNYHHNNILLMIMIVVIALVALIIGFTNWIDKKYYPYVIWSMAIALIFHVSLFTNYIPIQDVYGEFYTANVVIHSSLWNFGFPDPYNSVLSDTLLPSFIYHTCRISLNWMYKIIFPLLCSFLPVGLYSIYIKYLDKKSSFLASYLFVIIQPFYILIPFLTKQLTAEIFLLLILMLLTSKLHKFKMTLFTVFGMSLIVSHYGTSYLIMFMLLFTIVFLKIFEIIKKENIKNKISNELIGFTLIYTIFTLGWYMYISNSVSFASVVDIGNTIAHTISNEFLNPEYSRGAYTLTKNVHLLGQLLKYMYLTISGLIFIGSLKTLFDILKSKSNFSIIYLAFSIYWLGILGAAVAIPFFAVMNQYRLYHLAFFTLAPFNIIGTIFIFNLIKKLKMADINHNNIIKFLTIFFIFFMLLNTKFINEVVNQPSYSGYLSKDTILNQNNINETGSFYSEIIEIHDVFSAKWLSKNRNKNIKIYCTAGWGQGFAVLMAYGHIYWPNTILQIHEHTSNINDGYIYLYYFNVIKKIGLDNDPNGKFIFYYNFTEKYNKYILNNKIYDNGGSQILLSN